jgi:hypothetical protein
MVQDKDDRHRVKKNLAIENDSDLSRDRIRIHQPKENADSRIIKIGENKKSPGAVRC